MKSFALSILLIFFFLEDLYSQFNTKTKTKQNRIDKFSLSSFAYASHRDSMKLVSFLEIPYSVLQFVKNNNNYVGYYQASLSAIGADGIQLEQFVIRDSILVYDYVETKSLILNRKHFSTFEVSKSEEYIIIAELQDLDTRKKGLKKKTILYEFDEEKLGLLPPTFLLDLNGEWGFKSGKIPTHGQIVEEIGQGVDLNISGFINSAPFTIKVILNNNEVSDSIIISKKYQNNYGFFNEYLFITSNNLNSLKNDFSIILEQNDKILEQNISFSKLKSGITPYVVNIDLALKQMKYFMNSDDNYKQFLGDKKNKEKNFYDLWKDLDPTPNTETNELMNEYYKRVSYANENFDGWKDGWETDRGMIYILFGPPDQVERTNPSMANSTLYLIWTYNKINKQFIFKDQNGFGDFRLDSPFNGLGIRQF